MGRGRVMITKEDIDKAYENICSYIVDTPIIISATLSDLCGCTTLFKLENLQITGAFKERGALNKLMNLSESERSRGVIAASAGNHAQGVACHAKRLGIPATIVMPRGTPLVKITSTQYWGAKVILEGNSYDDAYAFAHEMAEKEGATYIHAFADPLVIAGQGTIGIEILRHHLCEDLDSVIVPIGGGGLISGIALYVKAVRPDIRIIGVETENCPAMKETLDCGHTRSISPSEPVCLADGIMVKKVNEINVEIVRRYVDEIVTVNDDEIANAILLLLEIEKIVVEGAGACPLAALLNKKIADVAGKKALSIISGGNIDVTLLSRIITRGLAFDGRLVQFQIQLRDVPGALESVLHLFHETNANILEIVHHHYTAGAPIGQINVTITLETKSFDHIAEIEKKLDANGYAAYRNTPISGEIS
jgi:threonine dehydratase